MRIFFAPHNDDEVLFGTYTLLAHKPRVIVVLRSFVQEFWTPPVTYQTREAETDAAMQYLGIEWTQWDHADDAPNWVAVAADMRMCDGPDLEVVYAPDVVEHGHPHHNWIGSLADEIFGKRVIHYSTYTSNGKTTSNERVPRQEEWPLRKESALLFYKSQWTHPYTEDHFARSLDEFYS